MPGGKFVVSGLSLDTTDQSLCQYFKAYGELRDGQVILKDGRPRGFGLVTFKEPASLPDDFTSSIHSIDGQQVSVKPEVLESEMRDMEPKGRKLFIGGLPSKTISADLEAYFSQFGEVVSAVVSHPDGCRRGYGFVTFFTKEEADQALNHPGGHCLNQRAVEVERAEQKSIWSKKKTTPPAQSEAGVYDGDAISRPEKIFVGGISNHTTEDSLRVYFSKFGEVLQTQVMRRKGCTRGFGFVVFARNQVAERVVAQRRHFLDGNLVECKTNTPIDRHLPKPGLDRGSDVGSTSSRGDMKWPPQAAANLHPQPSPVFVPEQPPPAHAPVLSTPDRLYVAAYANALLRAIGAPPAAVPYGPSGGGGWAPGAPQPPETPVWQTPYYTPY